MREFIDGATAIARGALDAGCDFFAGYPISPATPILLHMIRELPRLGGVAIQAEDEIASISMCIGAALAGARVLTATSGPGMSLYSENIGLAIMGEVPLVIVDTQRLGPATGGATTPGQGDIQFVRWGTSGGCPIIALSPGNLSEAYHLTRRAFALAERYRVPVFVMTEQSLVMSMNTVELIDGPGEPAGRPARREANPTPDRPGLRLEETMLPYDWDPVDGTPPFSPYGGPHIMRFTGSSHDEHGMLTTNPSMVARLNEHLWRKIIDHQDEIALVRSDLLAGARTLFISYGITAGAMQEAAIGLRAAGTPVSTLALQTLWPVPEREILAALGGPAGRDTVERVVVAELNHGQYLQEIERLVYRRAARCHSPAPEVVGLQRNDGELITPGQFRPFCLPGAEIP